MGSEQKTLCPPQNILDRIGRKGLCALVWHATPVPWRLIGFPYGLIVYRRLLMASDTLRYLRGMHAREFDCSLLFRLLRPRYRKVEQLLHNYGLQDNDTALTQGQGFDAALGEADNLHSQR